MESTEIRSFTQHFFGKCSDLAHLRKKQLNKKIGNLFYSHPKPGSLNERDLLEVKSETDAGIFLYSLNQKFSNLLSKNLKYFYIYLSPVFYSIFSYTQQNFIFHLQEDFYIIHNHILGFMLLHPQENFYIASDHILTFFFFSSLKRPCF